MRNGQTDVADPVSVENAIRKIVGRIGESVAELDRRYVIYQDALRAYDRAFAHAYLNAVGPAYTKKYSAELATIPERDALDIADAAYRYADRLAKALTEELRAWQSVGASVRMMYQNANGS